MYEYWDEWVKTGEVVRGTKIDHPFIFAYTWYKFYRSSKIDLRQYGHVRLDRTRITTVFIIILNSNNNLVWIMMTSMLYLFYFGALDKLDPEILDFWLFTELSILKWFSTWFFKYELIPIRKYFRTPVFIWSSSWPPYLALNFQHAGGIFSQIKKPSGYFGLRLQTTYWNDRKIKLHPVYRNLLYRKFYNK